MWKMKRRSISNDFEAKIAISNDIFVSQQMRNTYTAISMSCDYGPKPEIAIAPARKTKTNLFTLTTMCWKCPYFRHRQTVCLKIVHHCMVVTGRLARREGEDTYHPWIGAKAKPSATDTMAPVFHFKWNWEVSALQVVYYSTAINHAPSDLHASWLVPNLLRSK